MFIFVVTIKKKENTPMEIKSPNQVIESVLAAGTKKVRLTSGGNNCKMIISTMLAGAYIALGGILSVIIGYGFPEITANNPGMQKILSGAMFPIGLILVVVLGAELFTGNNAVLIPGYMRKDYNFISVIKNWCIVYFGNFAGAVIFTYFMVYLCGLTASGPYHDAIIKIAETKVSMPWHVVFLKGIGANWCVCAAVWLAISGHSLTDKMAGCWLPVMAFVALGYEHCIANMFFIPAGMLEGANISVTEAICNNLIPSTLGNIAGGSLLVGWIHAYLHLKK